MKPKPSEPGSAAPTDWDNVADWYDQLVGESGSEYHKHVVLPGAARLIGAQPGQKVLDMACGQGVLCRLLACKGVEMTGVDASGELIAVARERAGGSEHVGKLKELTAEVVSPVGSSKIGAIRYLVGDARELDFLSENSFDAAACLLAIQNIHPIGPVFVGAARVLKSGGKLVIVMMHPCFRGPKETEWGWDEKRKVQYRRVDRYLLPRKIPIVTHPGKDPGKYTWSFHKPIEAYVRALRNSGLLVDAIEEWASHKKSTSGPRAGAENVAREEIPMFLAIRGIKVGG
jgi:ubiquinone/menaquinone biosynthesis C-methylase UbiE